MKIRNVKAILALFLSGVMLILPAYGLELTHDVTAETRAVKSKEVYQGDLLRVSHAKESKQSKELLSKVAKPRAPDKRDHDTNTDFWIYDAWVTTRYDDDYDGYRTRIDVEFDVDTVYRHADIYAVLYLSRGNVYESYHQSSVFAIYGEDEDDALLVSSDLVTGFRPQEYDVLIEVYDAKDDQLLVSYDAYSDADLALVSLESEDYDVADTVTVVTTEHGGTLGVASGLLLPFLFRRKIAVTRSKKWAELCR
ncbi:choice-of-anchor H family protein [Aestuariibacter sp. AA17]|uniref:Choice-of-anchor H family protein n=1 Tax=Fluctibacter corallii TaxID=2984329 RepID=A0ABT3A4B5_9ALTE|nr:choice-of-anchor H family protein [Aestuariibacter sp. AA17]MCV2883231.1 choice-of-anchor H family protein [Aestuariibacter sp. AA17]